MAVGHPVKGDARNPLYCRRGGHKLRGASVGVQWRRREVFAGDGPNRLFASFYCLDCRLARKWEKG